MTDPNTCPQCGKTIEQPLQNKWRPFCSERCKLGDLGQWFSGRYAIPEDEERDAPPPELKVPRPG